MNKTTEFSKWDFICEQKIKLISILMEPQRVKIMYLLREKEMCVCEITKKLEIQQNLLSHHLKILREAGLLKATKTGQFVHYARNEEKVAELINNLKALIAKGEE